MKPASSSTIAPLVAVAGALLAVATLRTEPRLTSPPSVRSEVLDATSFLFREGSEPERGIAAIELLLERDPRGAGAVLRLQASALGPGVTPPRGFRFRPGENSITARELSRALEPGRLEAVVVQRSTGEERLATLALEESHRFTERALGPAGEVVEVNPRTLPAALEVTCGALDDGEWRLELRWEGRTRLVAELEVEADASLGVIHSVRALHSELESQLP